MNPAYVDILVSFSLVILTISLLLFVSSVFPMLMQAARTLLAYEKLANTLDTEVPATLQEFKQLAESVNALRRDTTQKVTDVGHKVEEVSGSIGLVAEEAKRKSSVWGTALLAGLRSYLSSKDSEERHPETRQITTDRGEQNVR